MILNLTIEAMPSQMYIREEKALQLGLSYKQFMMSMLLTMEQKGTEKIDIYFEFINGKTSYGKDVPITIAKEITEGTIDIMIPNGTAVGQEIS